MRLRTLSILCAVGFVFAWLPRGRGSESPDERKRQYDAEVPKTILELQQFRETTSIQGRDGVTTLINLNPAINVWYVLKIGERTWHLENPNPESARLLLDPGFPSGIVIQEDQKETKKRTHCELSGTGALQQGSSSQVTYYPLCDGRLYLRNPAKGHRTALETATEFLRERVWGGEKVIVMFHHLMADRYQATGELETGPAVKEQTGSSSERPPVAMIDPQYADRRVAAWNLGIALDPEEPNGLTPGAWYAAAGNPGIYVSILQPNFIAPAILQTYRTTVNNLDSVEASSLCYLIAFDLDRFDLAFAMGTEHPEVTWSARPTASMRDPRLAGPDGIGDVAPLISTGLIRPDVGRNTVAAFTGGFKRTHGAFRYGDLALRNHASHYGFLENGVVFSKLQPGLATLFVMDNGEVDMKTWAEADNAILGRIRHARQNGVPLIESDVPGALVGRWGPGNWSGSEDEKLRTIRAGVAIRKGRGRRFLIYAVFSDATPSAMARVFQAYQANYAMLLDMNALEHTYLAVYRRSGTDLAVDHLIKGMNQLDKSASNENVPRFLGFSDNRDFFYVTRRAGMAVSGTAAPPPGRSR